MGRTATAPARLAPGERLLHAFGAARADLVRRLARLLGSAADADDTAQEAFLKCWRARERAAGVRDLRAWIFRVGLNAARDLRRSAWRQRAVPLGSPNDLPGPAAESPGDHAARREALARLRAALAGLRPEEREVFRLRQNTGLTYEEIAARCAAPVGTVKTRMRSSLLKLRAALREAAGERGA
jgi:RNA polymerase sigma-70 factor (ECF subfamily)